MRAARPTVRVLREDLKLALPSANIQLDEIDHPVLKKATEQFADEKTPHERIRAIDDVVLFKVKVQRWRGAVWVDRALPWIVAVGVREEGSTDDFYSALAVGGKAARALWNRDNAEPCRTDTCVKGLLPNRDDQERLLLEEGARLRRELIDVVRALTKAALRDGSEHSADLGTFVLGIQVRADDGHATYVAVRITGSAPDNIVPVILARVPGCDRDTWAFDAALPNRPLHGAEQVWSTLMDPKAAAELLNEDE